jgi:hypothetical protein
VVVYKTFRTDLAHELGVSADVLKGPELKQEVRKQIGIAINRAHAARKATDKIQKKNDEPDESDESDSECDDPSSPMPKAKSQKTKRTKGSTGTSKLEKQLSALRKLTKVSGAGPTLYKALPEDIKEHVHELSKRLKRAGVPFKGLAPNSQEIARAERRRQLKQDMEGIDMSNIITGPTRRRRVSAKAQEQQQPMDESDDESGGDKESSSEEEDEEDSEFSGSEVESADEGSKKEVARNSKSRRTKGKGAA